LTLWTGACPEKKIKNTGQDPRFCLTSSANIKPLNWNGGEKSVPAKKKPASKASKAPAKKPAAKKKK
jgi:hypothetical protein